MSLKVLHLDTNHPLLIEQLAELGFRNDTDYTSPKTEIEAKVHAYDGLIIRSRIPIDAQFLKAATRLKFIGRVGAGLENIDVGMAKELGISLFNAPEGNRNAVGEHVLGMLLSLFNKLNSANREVRSGMWRREENRGFEVDGKIIGIIGYGNMGKAFAKKLSGFDAEVICYDIVGGVDDKNARQVGIMEFQKNVDVVSLHTPQTPETVGMINKEFIEAFHKPFWFLNTARGKSVVTKDLVDALKSGKVLGAGLDVLEYEKASFENLFTGGMPEAFEYLVNADNVLLTPHVAGWTVESKEKLAQTIVDKIKEKFS
ncbi:2-hydroxyacid dehydrogenase [Galbibacter sp. EGI 63066]|uniref:2-hydroxyacid dehydrogenase n=1 Tax=Galbibacter sp. EGI 63066 TaxID=2993559 RepID=UPI002248C0A8|nr:2-hydroxyacid dehydrogenase [Galbibacter sp. EGI 63066]MCX2681105.1 2-hydroxyacid dehydrogenase [Galbibacter sp. EGI 63066]